MSDKDSAKSQVEKFREVARELEADDSEEAFDAKVRKIAKASPLAPTVPKSDRRQQS